MKDEIKKDEIMSGACPFCGQFIEFDTPARDNDEARDFAVARCNCPGALVEKERNKKIRLASERIEALFGAAAYENGFEPIPSNEPLLLLSVAASLVVHGEISSATIKISGKCTACVTLGQKGNIVISRRETRASKLST